jgi:hypothetical protein
LEVKNTCPIHPDVVLSQLLREPEFVSEERKPTYTLDQITDSDDASHFFAKLWYAIKPLYRYHQIFDSDIVEKIKHALESVGARCIYALSLLIKDEHMPAVVDIAKEMIKMYFQNRNIERPNEVTLTYCLRKMTRLWNSIYRR